MNEKKMPFEVVLNIAREDILNDILNKLNYEQIYYEPQLQENFSFKFRNLDVKVYAEESVALLSINDSYKTKIRVFKKPRIKNGNIDYDFEILGNKNGKLSYEDFSRVYVLIDFIISNYGDRVPHTVNVTKNKKKKRVSICTYRINRDFLFDNVVFDGVEDTQYESILEIPTIKTTDSASNLLLDRFPEFNKESILIPFKEFNISLSSHVMYYCKLLTDTKMFIKTFLLGKLITTFIVYIDTFENGINFFVKDNVNDDNMLSRDQSIEVLVKIFVNLFFFTRYSVKKQRIYRDEVSKKISKTDKISDTETSNSTDKQKQKNGKHFVYPTERKVYVYLVDEEVEKPNRLKERKNVMYTKFNWVKKGHYRHYKSGKVVWIESIKCTRHEKLVAQKNVYLIDERKL